MKLADGRNEFALRDIVRIANAMPLGITVSDASGKLIFLNGSLERMTGHRPGSLLGHSVDALIPERNRAQHAAARNAYIKVPAERRMGAGRELFALRADGSEFPVEVGLVPIIVDGNHAVLASVIDISERRQLESSFRAIIEAAPYGMVLVDLTGTIRMANCHLNTLFGYGDRELHGQPIETLIPHKQREAHVAQRDVYIQAPVQRPMGSGRDLYGRHKDGTQIPVEIGLSSIATTDGRMLTATVIDISRRKRDELKLREANAQLEEFTNVSCHDLRSPLRGVSNLISFIREDYGETAPDGLMEQLDCIYDRVKGMDRLIDDLLSYARIGKQSLGIELIDLRSVVNDIIELQPIPEGMTLELDLDINSFDGARTPLQTAIRNLYSNAIKHHDQLEGRIVIKAHEEGDYCVVDVVDDGPGIPRYAQERVFQLFQTLKATKHEGSGLGLSMTKRIVESHGGRIELISIDGERGSLFRIWWPILIKGIVNE